MSNKIATLGTGCFWCTEAIFDQLKGVIQVTSGYIGGHVDNPDYRSVCNGITGHAEAIEITYDSAIIDYQTLLSVFWIVHDPTTLNRQGADVGTQYRSAIFYHNEEQREMAESSKIQAASLYDNPIVTEISPASKFYPAEAYHQNYFKNNPGNGYCQFSINPKLAKLRMKYTSLLKD